LDRVWAMSDYKKLKVWEKAHQLTLDVYRVTANFPKEEVYGLTSQIKRAAASIPANIAEGSGRGSNTELIRFLRIATGSAYELEYHILLASDLQFLNAASQEQLTDQVSEIKRMLTGLIQHLENNRS
jgi:four helix bundle protein